MTDVTIRNFMSSLVTKQEVFDFVCTSLINQGRGSYDPEFGDVGMCLYRHPDGAKCAVGHMIADEEYVPRMDGVGCGSNPEVGATGVMELIPNYFPALVGSASYETDVYFLRQLQGAHDDAAIRNFSHDGFVEAFKKNVKSVGNTYDLDTSVLGL
jgi:hypothetical protein